MQKLEHVWGTVGWPLYNQVPYLGVGGQGQVGSLYSEATCLGAAGAGDPCMVRSNASWVVVTSPPPTRPTPTTGDIMMARNDRKHYLPTTSLVGGSYSHFNGIFVLLLVVTQNFTLHLTVILIRLLHVFFSQIEKLPTLQAFSITQNPLQQYFHWSFVFATFLVWHKQFIKSWCVKGDRVFLKNCHSIWLVSSTFSL